MFSEEKIMSQNVEKVFGKNAFKKNKKKKGFIFSKKKLNE